MTQPFQQTSLSRLVIHQHPRVSTPCSLTFSTGMNILLGTNATGKTTLLEIITAILASKFSALQSPDGPVEFEFQTRTKQRYVHSQPAVMLLELRVLLPPVDVETDGRFARNDDRWTARSDATADPVPADAPVVTSAWTVSGQVMVGTLPGIEEREKVNHQQFRASIQGDVSGWGLTGADSSKLSDLRPCNPMEDGFISRLLASISNGFFPWDSDHETPLHEDIRAHLYPTSGGWSYRFDEALDYFNEILGRDTDEGLGGAFTGLRKTSHGMATYNTPSGVGRIAADDGLDAIERLTSDQVPVLGTIAKALGATSVSMRPTRFQRSAANSAMVHGFSFDFEWPGGYSHSHSYLSYGQKRLLAMFWYLAVAEYHSPLVKVPVVIDELTNGLHYDWIQQVITAIGDRQAFIASQNPLLVDMLEIPETPQAVREMFVLCRRDQATFSWSDPEGDQAERLLRSWHAGVQQFSELLREQGMW